MPLDNFLERLDKELLNHSVITDNKYCNWFKQAELSPVDVFYFTQQFSVFSNQFIIAQLNKVINAVDLEEARAGKEVLANELGVPMNMASIAMQQFDKGKKKYPNGDNWIVTKLIEEIVGAELHR